MSRPSVRRAKAAGKYQQKTETALKPASIAAAPDENDPTKKAARITKLTLKETTYDSQDIAVQMRAVRLLKEAAR